ncbi:aspartyl protease family protein [Maribellus sp. CM-23]|uniref:aspartyl protease family protein n=1 Tax=Maribellus sp. CM-23 TaxID=2781026 RepID=UPI001F418FF5|nr:aspartyl protease family protein [Maribellus sp. CM-23]MCE4564554.1 aspartyl protease family protein [Maribellus sp. CM-23]
MKNSFKLQILSVVLLFISGGCSTQWTKAIQRGKISSEAFHENVSVEIQKKLILVPVTIRGKQYRFLFDTGAPFSISSYLQKEYGFKKVSSGSIRDSDHNRQKVDWVQVDSVSIGSVAFVNQTAFVADFEANPVISCLGIDGIIGSNLIRHCNWTIDQEQKLLTFDSNIDALALKESVSIPFETDHQYNIFIDVNLGQARVKNLLLDYGSNGSVALNKEVFATLKEHAVLGNTFKEKGIQQTGIIGESVVLSREITWSDSLRIGHLNPENVLLKTGKTDLIGNDFLSRFRVTIDWENKRLYLSETGTQQAISGSFGFRIGTSPKNGIYIQSVTENSPAHKKGIEPNMKVTKVDNLDFEKDHDFCDYMSYEPGDTVFLEVVDAEGKKREFRIEKAVLK